jgi:hypothetical protein
MPDTGAPYFIPYVEPTDLVRDYPDASEDLALAIVAALENIPVTEKRIEAFTGSGNWTVPAGVTYAIAHMIGGGGGGGSESGTNATDGGNSSVAFTGGTVVAEGGKRATTATAGVGTLGQTPPANSGRGGGSNRDGGDGTAGPGNRASSMGGLNSTWIVAGAAVTPAEVIAVVVGAGGAKATGGNQGADGAAGYVYIEYYEEV